MFSMYLFIIKLQKQQVLQHLFNVISTFRDYYSVFIIHPAGQGTIPSTRVGFSFCFPSMDWQQFLWVLLLLFIAVSTKLINFKVLIA